MFGVGCWASCQPPVSDDACQGDQTVYSTASDMCGSRSCSQPASQREGQQASRTRKRKAEEVEHSQCLQGQQQQSPDSAALQNEAEASGSCSLSGVGVSVTGLGELIMREGLARSCACELERQSLDQPMDEVCVCVKQMGCLLYSCVKLVNELPCASHLISPVHFSIQILSSCVRSAIGRWPQNSVTPPDVGVLAVRVQRERVPDPASELQVRCGKVLELCMCVTCWDQ